MQTTSNPTFPGTDDQTLLEQASKAAAQVKDKVTDLGHAAVARLEGSRDSAAVGLESAASALHGKAEAVTGIAHSTAEKMTSTADYLRGHDLKAMMSDVEHLVKRNPGVSLVAAAVVGFLTARALRRSD